MLGARHRIEQGIPGILVDAQVGRQASHSVPIVNDHLLHNQRIERVVLHIGTNGYIYEKDLRKLLSLLQEKGVQRVLVVNIHADRRWTKTNNELIDRIAPEFANVRIGRGSAELLCLAFTEWLLFLFFPAAGGMAGAEREPPGTVR